ncbi:NAD(P)H-hydrate epimerase [Novosphingobium aerophilum]|nr:NAD(P)H-hydrate epimerase [Novosphingobium aerophilum]
MTPAAAQVLTVAQMRAAEADLIAAGTSVDALMQRAGRGAADWVWRIAAGRAVTVLCGPGNNGGDGYVIAEALRERGARVRVIAATEPRTEAARTARGLYRGEVSGPGADPTGEVLVDCLFGSGLTRPLSGELLALLASLARGHALRIAIDVPSGIDSDMALALNPGLPDWSMTVALGAWKPAHFLMPARAAMGELRLVDIGCAPVPGAAGVVARPCLSAPGADAHKYRRGLVAVVAGAMPGAARLASLAAQGAAAGYVRLIRSPSDAAGGTVTAGESAPDIVPGGFALLGDGRTGAVLVGPGLGRDDQARQRLVAALSHSHPAVIDADALMLLQPQDLVGYPAPLLLTPHEGELVALERAWAQPGQGTRLDRARALAQATGTVVIAKGPDTVIAAPDGRTAFAPRASSWLSVAGTGDVLAGIAAARLASHRDPFAAAGEAVWLHGEAARLAGPAFSASQLAATVRSAYAACL